MKQNKWDGSGPSILLSLPTHDSNDDLMKRLALAQEVLHGTQRIIALLQLKSELRLHMERRAYGSNRRRGTSCPIRLPDFSFALSFSSLLFRYLFDSPMF
jgi:hypothetical protein